MRCNQDKGEAEKEVLAGILALFLTYVIKGNKKYLMMTQNFCFISLLNSPLPSLSNKVLVQKLQIQPLILSKEHIHVRAWIIPHCLTPF